MDITGAKSQDRRMLSESTPITPDNNFSQRVENSWGDALIWMKKQLITISILMGILGIEWVCHW